MGGFLSPKFNLAKCPSHRELFVNQIPQSSSFPYVNRTLVLVIVDMLHLPVWKGNVVLRKMKSFRSTFSGNKKLSWQVTTESFKTASKISLGNRRRDFLQKQEDSILFHNTAFVHLETVLVERTNDNPWYYISKEEYILNFKLFKSMHGRHCFIITLPRCSPHAAFLSVPYMEFLLISLISLFRVFIVHLFLKQNNFQRIWDTSDTSIIKSKTFGNELQL